jgi:hypothetical protein
VLKAQGFEITTAFFDQCGDRVVVEISKIIRPQGNAFVARNASRSELQSDRRKVF